VTTIGLLALQGDYQKHGERFEFLGVSTKKVRSPDDLKYIDGLVMPGGESTTMGKLIEREQLAEPLIERIRSGMPVFATCAGLILLAKQVAGYDQVHLGALDVDVARNAYGRQIESFEVDIESPFFGSPPIRGVFIRAPLIKRYGDDIEVLAEYENVPVLVRQQKILAASFHPELTDDLRIQEYFLTSL